MIKKATREQIQNIYKKHIKKDFPAKERCSYKEFLKGYEQGKLLVYLYTQKNTSKAYFVFSQTDQMIFLQYFAVFENERAKGIGTKALEEFLEDIVKEKIICLEIEDPKKSINQKQRDIRNKRKHFYEKVGFCIQEGIQKI